MAVYSKLSATALKLIKKKGELVTLKINSEGTIPDPNKPWKPNADSTITVNNVAAIFFPADKGIEWASDFETRKGDYLVLVSASGLTNYPDLGSHFIRTSGQVVVVQDMKKLDPNGEAIIFMIHGRI